MTLNKFTNFRPSAQDRLAKRRINKYFPVGTSPATTTIQLPEYGMYRWMLVVGYVNLQTTMLATGQTVWFKNDGADGSTSNQNSLLKTWQTSPSVAAGSATANDMASISVSDPDSTGLITITATWTTSATSRTPFLSFTYEVPFDRWDIRSLP